MLASLSIRTVRNFSKIVSLMEAEVAYSHVPPHRYQDVIDHLRRNFFAHEPLNKSLNLCEPGESHAELEAYSCNILKQDMSSMATIGADKEIVGVCLVGGTSKELTSEKCTDPKLVKIFEFITGLAKDVEIGDPAYVVDINILSVDGRLRGRGVGGKLYQHSEQTAKEKGIKLMRAEATALFTQKILEKYGWETVKEVRYNEYPTKDNPKFRVEPPHETFKIMIKRLN